MTTNANTLNQPSIRVVDDVDDVKIALSGLSTIALSLAQSDMADKPSLELMAEILDVCSSKLEEASAEALEAVVTARTALENLARAEERAVQFAEKAAAAKSPQDERQGYFYAFMDVSELPLSA